MPISSISISPTDFGILFICYTVSLAIFTVWGEFTLLKNRPPPSSNEVNHTTRQYLN
jgi:hypothetical protein